jgi:putative nucleotidyltransferase with HDIG domain
VTIGSVLSDLEPSRPPLAAPASEDRFLLQRRIGGTYRSTSLDISTVVRIERGPADHGTASDRVQSSLGNGHGGEDVAAYRRPAPAPAPVGLVDDVDLNIDALFQQLEISSPLMAEHSRAVSAWCARLARTIGLSEAEIAFVTRCGLIHDIGKLYTPAEILEAPRKLTPDEWVIMRAHTTEGGLMVARIPIPRRCSCQGHHHERAHRDGRRLLQRVIGRRPYRPAMPPTEALTELERHGGTQFDPDIVSAMAQIVLGRMVEPTDH